MSDNFDSESWYLQPDLEPWGYDEEPQYLKADLERLPEPWHLRADLEPWHLESSQAADEAALQEQRLVFLASLKNLLRLREAEAGRGRN